MDALGHVNNTIYFRYLEIARLEWMRSIGIDNYAAGEGLVMVNAFCNFHRQLTFPGEIVVRSYVGTCGNSSCDTWATMHLAEHNEVIVASGGATVVWTDLGSQRSKPIPGDVRARMLSE